MKRVHYEVRFSQCDSRTLSTTFRRDHLEAAKWHAKWLRETGRLTPTEADSVRLVKVTVEHLPLRAKRVKRVKP